MGQPAPVLQFPVPTNTQPYKAPTFTQHVGNFLTSPKGVALVAVTAFGAGYIIRRKPKAVSQASAQTVPAVDVKKGCLEALEAWAGHAHVHTPSSENLTPEEALTVYEKAVEAEERRGKAEAQALEDLAVRAGLK